MKKLLLLLLSLFSFLFLFGNAVNAESKYFYSANCSIFSQCPSHFLDYPLGLPNSASANFGDPYKTNFVNNICKALTKNNDSYYKNFAISSNSTYVVISTDTTNSNYFGHVRGQPFNFIQCEVPPPKIPGCTNPNAYNYNPEATEDNGTCVSKLEGCTDSEATTYNPQANIHVESMCQYPTPYTPQDITGYIDNSTVQSGATTWNITLNVNMTGATLNINKIQTWNQFTIINAVTNEKQITITLQQFDGQRLSVECTNYELTIPKNAINTEKGDTNANPITGNFTVAGCPTPTTPPDGEDTGSGTQAPVHKNTIKENNIYLSLYDTDEEGKIYLNMTNLVYLVGILSAFSIFFFVLFGFIKNSFLGKSKKSYR